MIFSQFQFSFIAWTYPQNLTKEASGINKMIFFRTQDKVGAVGMRGAKTNTIIRCVFCTHLSVVAAANRSNKTIHATPGTATLYHNLLAALVCCRCCQLMQQSKRQYFAGHYQGLSGSATLYIQKF